MNIKILLATCTFFASTCFADIRVIELVIQNGMFLPTQIEISSDERIELLIKNQGTDAEEFESLALRKEKIILPAKSTTIKLGPLAKGTYRFFGDFHPTTASGAIIVK